MADSIIDDIQRIYYPVLAAVGVVANVVAIVILSRGKCGLSECITRYLVGMAVADLLVVIVDPLLKWTVRNYVRFAFLSITPVCSLSNFLCLATGGVSVWLTVAFTFDRYVAICCDNLKATYCTPRTAGMVLGSVGTLGYLFSIPWYFLYRPLVIINDVPWGCAAKSSYLTSPAWVAFDFFHRVLTSFVPFFLILLLNVLTVRRILVASRVRRGLRGESNREKGKDPELANRRKSIILLFSISASFILLRVTYVGYNIYARVVVIRSYYSYTDPRYITDRAAQMLQALSTCTNTCIYAVTQSKFREELRNGVKYPLTLLVKLVKGRGS